MGADPVLVQGAYRAAGSGGEFSHWRQKAHDRLMRISEEVTKWDYGSGAKKVLDMGGALPPAETAATRKKLTGMKEAYINGNKEEQAEKIAETNKIAQEDSSYGDIRSGLASDYLAGNLSAGFLRTPQGKEIMELMKHEGGGARLVEFECPEGEEDCTNKGNRGVKLTDYKKIGDTNDSMHEAKREINKIEKLMETGEWKEDDTQLNALYAEVRGYQDLLDSDPKVWTSLEQLQGMIGHVDSSTINILEAMRSKNYDEGFNTSPEDEVEFNIKKNLQTINTTIVGKGDMQSMIYDEMIPGRTFYGDLMKHIMCADADCETGRTYADFGVTDEMMGTADQNADGIIDEGEADIIAQAVANDPVVIKEEMSDYMLRYLKNNHQLGLDSRRLSKTDDVKEESENEKYKPPTSEEREQKNIEIIERDVVEKRREYEDITPATINTDYS
tara:strand:- start:12066 stop:13397 length:1332 start_codon:yes stop_codon:yes gene_type:complete